MPAIKPIFSIDKLTHDGGSITTILSVNKDSEIFNGHFPGRPVVPGACMLQVVKDVLETALNKTLQLKKAGQLKFISMIDPNEAQAVQLDIAYTFEEEIKVTAKLTSSGAACFKFQGVFLFDQND
jgi:3-hydroxyacyl-[acyl-carrier-protein] dehydratase